MTWHTAVWHWLAQAALGGTLLLLAGCLAVRLSKQPARRLRLIELTLLGCLLVPWLSRLPALPHWSAGLLGNAPPPDGLVADSQFGPTTAPGEPFSSPLPAPVPAGTEDVVSSSESAAPAAPPAPAPAAEAVRSWEWPPLSLVAVLVYGAGVALFASRWLVGLVWLRRLLRGATPAPPDVAALFDDVAGPAGRRVRLLLTDRLSLPLTFGWRAPVILLPAELCGDAAALRYALAHEWSHVERRDLWRWHLAGLALLLFYWQPLFWWLRRQLRLGQDYLADALAARQAREAEDYAAFLVGLARRSLGRPLAGALGIGDRRSNLYRRILMLVNNREPLQRRCAGAWNLAAIAAAVVLTGAASLVRLDAADPPKADKAPPKKLGAKDKDPADAEKLDYSGKVTDKDTGKPIEGAVITVRRSVYGDPEVTPEDWIIQETKHKTDKDGKYSFTLPPAQTARYYLYIELDAEAPGYAPQKGFGYSFGMIRKNEKMGGRPFFEAVTLRAGKEISGTVETPDGKPAAGVKVLAYSVTNKLHFARFPPT